jgi:hypothetical protein
MLTQVLDRLAFDCPWHIPPGKRPPDQYDPKCKARFLDLDRVSPPPPDEPPSLRRLKIIRGDGR